MGMFRNMSRYVIAVVGMYCYGGVILLQTNMLYAVQLHYSHLTADRIGHIHITSHGNVTSENISYDSDGNLESMSGFVYINRDEESRPVNIFHCRSGVHRRYNGLDHCLSRSGSSGDVSIVPNYSGKLKNTLMEFDQDNNGKYFIYANRLSHRINGDGSVAYFHTDEMGNVLALSSQYGEVTDSYEYDVYGKLMARSGDTDNVYLFAGGLGVYCEDAETGLYDMKARYYSALLKRFISRDPIGLAGGRNLYAYAAGNPLMYVDPRGWCAEDAVSASDMQNLWLTHLMDNVFSFLDIFGSSVYAQDIVDNEGDAVSYVSLEYQDKYQRALVDKSVSDFGLLPGNQAQPSSLSKTFDKTFDQVHAEYWTAEEMYYFTRKKSMKDVPVSEQYRIRCAFIPCGESLIEYFPRKMNVTIYKEEVHMPASNPRYTVYKTMEKGIPVYRDALHYVVEPGYIYRGDEGQFYYVSTHGVYVPPKDIYQDQIKLNKYSYLADRYKPSRIQKRRWNQVNASAESNGRVIDYVRKKGAYYTPDFEDIFK